MKARMGGLASRDRSRQIEVRGRGMVLGLDFGTGATAAGVVARAFEQGLIIERCGTQDQVVKLLPPLTINDDQLERGLEILENAIN